MRAFSLSPPPSGSRPPTPRGRAALACLATALAAGCGGDDADPTAGLTVKYSLSRGESSVSCADADEVQAVRVTLYAPDGLTVRAGYPKTEQGCSGTFSDPGVAAGKYVIEVAATGSFGGDPAAVLYRARREIELPDPSLELSLAPEVSFLSVSWSFETMNNLEPCQGEVGDIYLFVSTEAAGSGSYQNLGLSCEDSPFVIPQPFLPQGYTIQLEAYSAETGRKLYSVREQRILERGENPRYHAIFEPIGGRLFFDFQFGIRGAIAQTCDDPRVGAQEVTATVRSTLGDDPVQEVISCTAQRPLTLSGVRFVQAQRLELELVAEGVHRFRATRAVVMPEGDADLALLTLQAVGSATVAVTITSSSGCMNFAADRFEVTVVDPASGMIVREGTISASGRSLSLSDVPYGEYMVGVVGKRNMNELCRATGLRSIDARQNAWAPFSL